MDCLTTQFRDNRRNLPSAKPLEVIFTDEVCPCNHGQQASSALEKLLVLPEHAAGLTPLSPDSLKDGLILLP